MSETLPIPAHVRDGELLPPVPETSRTLSPVYTENQVALYLNLSPEQVRQMRERGDGPPFINIAPRVFRYLEKDLLDWIGARRRIASGEIVRRAA